MWIITWYLTKSLNLVSYLLLLISSRDKEWLQITLFKGKDMGTKIYSKRMQGQENNINNNKALKHISATNLLDS